MEAVQERVKVNSREQGGGIKVRSREHGRRVRVRSREDWNGVTLLLWSSVRASEFDSLLGR